MKKHLMKIQEAADYLGIHRNTLNNWVTQSRKLTFLRDPITGYRYFEKEDLDAFIAGMKVSSNRTESLTN